MQTILQILIALLFSHLSVSDCAEEANSELAYNPSTEVHWVQHHCLDLMEISEKV